MTKLSLEDKIMGRKEPLPPTDLQLKAFTNETKYLVYAEGNDNKKVVTGVKIGRILSMEDKQLITSGEKQVKANGLVIERIEEQGIYNLISELNALSFVSFGSEIFGVNAEM